MQNETGSHFLSNWKTGKSVSECLERGAFSAAAGGVTLPAWCPCTLLSVMAL